MWKKINTKRLWLLSQNSKYTVFFVEIKECKNWETKDNLKESSTSTKTIAIKNITQQFVDKTKIENQPTIFRTKNWIWDLK